MREDIVVVGGYGHVGQKLSLLLAEQFPGKVIAAGRNKKRAEQFSRQSRGKVRAMELDISKPIHADKLKGVKLIVMCIDQQDTPFVEACLRLGIHYIDVTASYDFFSRVEKLDHAAVAGGAIALLSVGLAPGISNLLARRTYEFLDRTDRTDITIMLGLGDAHGQAAIEWTIDHLDGSYTVEEAGRSRLVGSFTDGRAVSLGAPWGKRQAYRFNFADQHVLVRTLGIPAVATRLCLDSAWMTGLLHMLKLAGITRLLAFNPIRTAAVRVFGSMRFGSDAFALKVEASGILDGKPVIAECLLHGSNESAMTAKAAAAAAASLYRAARDPGVYHIEQLFRLEDLFDPAAEGIQTAVIHSKCIS